MPTPEKSHKVTRDISRGKPVADAIDNLYHVFQKYRFTDMEGDLCFPGSCNPAPLLAAPLRQLEAEAFIAFSHKAVTTWGTSNDLKHFLPRMIELSLFEDSVLERWLVFNKIQYAKWRSWPRQETDAINKIIKCAFEWIISGPLHPYGQTAGDRLGNVVQTGDGKSYYEYASRFLRDLNDLDASLTDAMFLLWSHRMEAEESQGPILAMALVYLELNMSKPVLPNAWYKDQRHIKYLADAWESHQNDPAFSIIYSEAHAAAERYRAYER